MIWKAFSSIAVTRVGTALLFLLICGCAHAQSDVGESYEGNPLAIVDVTVIDVASGTAKPHQTVVVRYGKIDHIKPASDFETPGWMTVVSGLEKFLIPGLWDVHVHLSFWDEPDTDEAIPGWEPDPDAYREVMGQLVAWGVTSARDMGGDLDTIDRWRERIEKGEVVGPTVFRAGPYIDGPKPNSKYRMFVTDADEAREAADAEGGRLPQDPFASTS